MNMLKHILAILLLILLFNAKAAVKPGIQYLSPNVLLNEINSSDKLPYRFGDRVFLVGYAANPAKVIVEGAKAGLVLNGFAGGGYFYFSAPATQLQQLLRIQGLEKVGYLRPSSKLSSFLTSNNETAERFGNGQSFNLKVYYGKGLSAISLRTALQSEGFFPSNIDENFGHFTIRGHKRDADKLALQPFVRYIALETKEAMPLLNTAVSLNRANKVHAPTPNGLGYTGRGINVAVIDGGYVGPHIDFERRVTHVERLNIGATNSQHGTHVTGTVAGAGHRNEAYRGMAPKANVFEWNYTDDMINKMRQGILEYNTMVSNNSYYFGEYGIFCGFSGAYVPESQDMDELAVLYPSYLPVIASGNSGNLCAGGWGTLPVGIQGSKNNLVVGRCDDNSVVDAGSSRGPTADGRLKPELVAEGLSVLATYPLQAYGTYSGTSMSAPQVSGAVALIYEAYKAAHGVLPPAMLSRALLCNTAYDLGLPGPDFTHGFGRMDVYKAIKALENGQFFIDDVANEDSVTFTVNVPSGTAVSRFMLSWTDMPATLPYQKILVNDLDIYVIAPGGSRKLPLVADAQNPGMAASPARDSLNNMEQVVISSPVSGTYTIVVKGREVPAGPQAFAVVFQNDPAGIDVTYPDGGESLLPGSNAIRWDANGITGNVDISYSDNGGSSWNPIASGIPASQSYFFWTVPVIATNQALVRVTGGAQTGISTQTFTIMPNVSGLTTSQCDRGVRMNWNKNNLATEYVVYRFLYADTAWQQIATTTDTVFWMNDLKPGFVYFVSVASKKGTILSRKAEGVGITANSTAICSAVNDAGVYHLLTPIGGRQFTSSVLSNAETIRCVLKNYGNNTIGNFNVSYSVNGGPVVTELFSGNIPAGDTAKKEFAATYNFSSPGDYTVKLWTTLAGDVFSGNDTLRFIVRHLPNGSVVLPFVENFDQLPGYDIYTYRMVGLPGLDPFDLISDSLRARARIGVLDLYSSSSPNAITIDHLAGGAALPQLDASLFITLNLSNYIDSVIFLDFSYASHNEPGDNDFVRVRGSDTDPWITIYNLFANRLPAGFYQDVHQINLTGWLKSNGQNYSSSTQIAFNVRTNRSANQYINQGGYSFDDIRVYHAGKDIALTTDASAVSFCSGEYQLQVNIINNTPQAVSNIPLFYSVNNGTPVAEVANINLPAWGGTTYTFTAPVVGNADPSGKYTVRAWVQMPGDKFGDNDTTVIKNILKLKLIALIPEADDFYQEGFESSDGGWMASGRLSSWVWGTPEKYIMTKAGMGNNAWANTLTRDYNNNEDSYLYGPCLMSPNANTSLSFLSQLQIEASFDSLIAEYSFDGSSWSRLGTKGAGYNWYNSASPGNFWDKNIFPWQSVSLYSLPTDPMSRPMLMRFRLMADQFVTFEGLGIDQVFYDNLPGLIAVSTANASVIANMQNFSAITNGGGSVLAEVKASGGTPEIKVHTIVSSEPPPPKFRERFILNTRWHLETVSGNFSVLTVRLYFADSLFKRMLNADAATSLLRDLRLVRYNDISLDTSLLNNHFANGYTVYDPSSFAIWPFKNGYFIEFQTDHPGEFWLQSGTPNPAAYNSTRFSEFSATRDDSKAILDWQTIQEIANRRFYLEYSYDGVSFALFDSVPGGGRLESGSRDYQYIDSITGKPNGYMYYRLSQVDSSGKLYYAGVDTVDFTNVSVNDLAFSASWQLNGLWLDVRTAIDGMADVVIYNSAGALLDKYHVTLQKGRNYLGRSYMNSWPSGVYIIRLGSGKLQGSCRFVKIN
jgi:hypothetical protein